MDSLVVSSKRVQRFEGKLNICLGKQLSVRYEGKKCKDYIIGREITAVHCRT